MVVITRAAATNRRQPSNVDTTIQPTKAGRKNGRKKGKVANRRASTSTTLFASQPDPPMLSDIVIATSASDDSDPVGCLIHTSDTTTAIGPTSEFNHLQDSAGDIAENHVDQSDNVHMTKVDQMNNNLIEESCDSDNGEEFDRNKSWPIIVGEIEWCKTNRSNDRLCMCGYTYDYMSKSLKKNIRYFRCSMKSNGCRAVVRVFIDSNAYKDSNGVEHNHPPNLNNVKRLLVLQKIKERVMAEPTPVTRIIEDEYIKHQLNEGDHEHFLLPAAQGEKYRKT